MTEEEAWGKWCPFARVHLGTCNGAANVSVNRLGGASNDPKCRASACMAWRWDPYNNFGDQSAQTPRTRGHCGLAGPQSA